MTVVVDRVVKRLRHKRFPPQRVPSIYSENYRKGKEVELADKTKFNYSGTDIHGIRANKLALVASILIDGGLSYMVYKGLNAIFGKKHDPAEAGTLSPGYYSAMEDMEGQRPVINNDHIRFDSRSRNGR